MISWVRRHPVRGGFALMFACTWPIDLWAAADSHGWTSVRIPPVLPLLVGYGFVVASIVATWVVDGRGGVRALLQRFLIWRVGLRWYAVILLGWAAVDLTAIALHVVLGGPVPDFSHPFAVRIMPPGMNLWAAAPLFLLFAAFTNAEEIGWRGYALPRLQARHGALAATLVIGIVWAFWHVPKFLTAGSAQDSYPFWVYVVDTTAKAVVFTWVFTSTKGSLLAVMLLHASLNTSTIFLPVLPVAAGDVRPMLIAIGLHCAAAVVIVLATGPARLSRANGSDQVGTSTLCEERSSPPAP